MRVILKAGLMVLVGESEAEQVEFAAWRNTAQRHVFAFVSHSERGGALHDLGLREDACREPINISYRVAPQWQAISNFALAPFVLDGRYYASVEGFWQGLKFESESDRRRVASLYAGEAKRAGEAGIPRVSFEYDGQQILPGSVEHWALMQRACEAKFAQNTDAREALLSTGQRPLMHRMRKDSRTIPGVIMADIWMRVREGLWSAATKA